MDQEDSVQSVSGKRVYRTVAEKRRIVELTRQSGASVAKVTNFAGTPTRVYRFTLDDLLTSAPAFQR